MKKLIFIVVFGFFLMFASVPSCQPKTASIETQNSVQQQVTVQAEKKEVWTCPMHPEIKKDGPGRCPVCGMNLEKVAATPAAK